MQGQSRQIEYFTSSGRKILRMSQSIALRRLYEEITLDHILLAMTRATDTNAYHALQDVDIIEGKLAQYLSVLHPANSDHPLRFQGLAFSDEAQTLFNLALMDAKLRGNHYIASAHLLVTIARMNSPVVDAILEHFSLERKAVIKATEYYFEHSVEIEKHRIPIEMADDDTMGCLPALRDFLYDLTRKRKKDE